MSAHPLTSGIAGALHGIHVAPGYDAREAEQLLPRHTPPCGGCSIPHEAQDFSLPLIRQSTQLLQNLVHRPRAHPGLLR